MMQRASLMSYLSAPRRWPVTTALAFLVSAASVVVLACAPYVFDRDGVGREIAAQIRTATGLQISTADAVQFNLLPRPNIVADGVRIVDPSGAISIDAVQLRGHARLLPLLVGRVELTDASLVRPQMAIDLDSRPASPDNTIGRALNGSADSEVQHSTSLGIVTLVEGSAVLKSRKFSKLPKLEKLNLTIDWPDVGSPATMTGSGVVQGVPTDFTTWLAEPSSLMRGGRTDLTVNVHSSALDLNAIGEITSADPFGFKGHLVTSGPSLANLLDRADLDIPLPAPFQNFGLTADATFSADREGQPVLDLQSLQLRADGNAYDGTLAIQGGAQPLITGTLASEQVNLAPFLKWLPNPLDDQHRWSQTPTRIPAGPPFSFDLRVSAGRLRVASLTLSDAAISILTREGRTEFGLIEGKAYGGSVRGRLSIGPSGSAMDVRAAASVSDMDASTLGWDILGHQIATGTLAASVNLEASGDTPFALINNLTGSGKLGLQNGELSTFDLADTRHDSARNDSGRGRTPFQSLSLDARISDGAALVNQGALSGAGADWTVLGKVDFVRAVADLTASRGGPDQPGAQKLSITGPLTKLVVAPAPVDRP